MADHSAEWDRRRVLVLSATLSPWAARGRLPPPASPAWWRGQGPNWRERAKDARRMVERLAEEIAAELEAEAAEPKDKR